jgi:hypothetical protein
MHEAGLSDVALYRRGIRIYRSISLTEEQITRRLNIPVTVARRTIADLERVVPPALARKAPQTGRISPPPTRC